MPNEVDFVDCFCMGPQNGAPKCPCRMREDAYRRVFQNIPELPSDYKSIIGKTDGDPK